jgi:hypothetical protein
LLYNIVDIWLAKYQSNLQWVLLIIIHDREIKMAG